MSGSTNKMCILCGSIHKADELFCGNCGGAGAFGVGQLVKSNLQASSGNTPNASNQPGILLANNHSASIVVSSTPVPTATSISTSSPTPTPQPTPRNALCQADWSHCMNGWTGVSEWKATPGFLLRAGQVGLANGYCQIQVSSFQVLALRPDPVLQMWAAV
jgi:hypothetical protein